MEYSYYLNEHNNVLTIYENNTILCTVSEVYTETDAAELMAEIIQELREV